MTRISLVLAVGALFACSGCGSSSGGSNSGTSGGGGTTSPPSSAPAISLSAASATFSAAAGAASPAGQSIAITNGGTGTLSGLAAGSVAYTGGSSQGWLTANLSGATAPTTLTLTPATSTLAVGTYTATVPISASVTGVTNSPQVVSVTLTVGVGAAAKLVFLTQPASNSGSLTPAPTVAIEDALGNVVTTATTSVTLAFSANAAGATLGGTTTVAAVAGIATFNGLTVSKGGTGFTLAASASGLTTATSNAFDVTSAAAPAILLSAASATFSVGAGAASPAGQSITITNGGTGTLSGLAVGSVVYTAGPSQGWLTANLSGATAPATLTLTAATSTLAVGTYTATIPITASVTGVTNSPQVVSARLTVAVGAAAKLVFLTQPASNSGSLTTAPTVAIEDVLGNVVTTATTSVTVALGTNTAGAALGGTTTVAAVAGIATFNGLTISTPGTGFTLVASATALTGATSNAFNVTSAVAATTLATIGQSISFLTSPNFSTTLAVQANSQYLIEVTNTSSSYTLQDGFSLTGSFAGSSAAAAQRAFANRTPASVGPTRQAAARADYSLPGSPVSMAKMRAMAQNHVAILGANRQILQNAGSARAAWSAARAAINRNTGISAAAASTSIGTVNKLYVRNSLAATCSAVDSIGARTVAVGQHVVVVADTNLTKWPQAYRPDSSYYQIFANEYDAVTWPHLLANIGNPLAFDGTLSGANKVMVVITPTLNNLGGLAGGGIVVAFVNSCDFFPSKSAAIGNGFSNQTEAFYSFVPSANGYDVATWEAQLRATAAHETKHIVSLGQRINNNSPAFEEIWLEEGLAQASSEIWERNFNQAVWKGNANFVQTLGCEYQFSNIPCNASGGKPFALAASHLPFFFEYLQTESTSSTEGLGLDTPSNYGAGWAFSRWIIDQYATSSEGTFVQALIGEQQLTGLNNLAAHTGQSIQTLLVYFNLASAIYKGQTFTPVDVRATIPSFNFANIDSIAQNGLTCGGVKCGIFTTNGSPLPIFPVSPSAVSTTASFSRAYNTVPGTSAVYFLLSAPASGIESLQLLTPAGNALAASSAFRVAILRVQ